MLSGFELLNREGITDRITTKETSMSATYEVAASAGLSSLAVTSPVDLSMFTPYSNKSVVPAQRPHLGVGSSLVTGLTGEGVKARPKLDAGSPSRWPESAAQGSDLDDTTGATTARRTRRPNRGPEGLSWMPGGGPQIGPGQAASPAEADPRSAPDPGPTLGRPSSMITLESPRGLGPPRP